MSNIFVTGATGFLGRHLCPVLEAKGHKVFISNSKTASLMDLWSILSVYPRHQFDYIFHLAAVTKAGDYCLTHSGDQWVNNQTINTNILRYWKEYQPQAKMICMGTSCSYAPDIRMVEGNYLLGEPDPGLYTYAMTKRMLLMGLKALSKQYPEMRWLYFIPSTLYGANFDLADNHFIFDFIRNGYNLKYHGTPWSIWGTGEQRRELVHVNDAVNAMIKLMDVDNMVLNLGSGQDNPVNDFARLVCDAYGLDSSLVGHDLTKYVGVHSKVLDPSTINRFLAPGKLVNVSLKDGIQEAAVYFSERQQQATEHEQR